MFVATQLAGQNRLFSFEAVKCPKDAFFVVQFEGEEALSALYRFELLLASKDSDIDAGALIGTAAHFSLSDGVVDGQPATYQGLIQEFSYEYESGGWTFYQAILVPVLWKLETFVLSEVYLDKSRPEIFNTVLENAGMRRNDFEMRLSSDSANAPKLEYICQYRESYLTFISRWAERLGVYWWYENTGGQEKAVFTDLRTAHKDEATTLHYQPAGELDAQSTQKRRCQRLRQVAQNQPKHVVIRDFSAHRASQELKGTAPVDPETGIGEMHFFGRKLKSVMDIEQRAKIAAESLRCRAVRYFGSSTATGLRCGHFVRLAGHPRNSFNRRYLLTEATHRGSQAGLLLDGLGIDTKQKISDFYLADFTAIPDDVQFRPEERHPWPRIIGTINAFIDAEGSGQYAELNQYGEYKVQVPFAMSKKSDYRGSAWIRMATPYAGSDHGCISRC
ncbi:type VI secretion system tip protein VgrG [Candidatus Methylospira mobilis]|uniref:Type VI secretion system tip protein VgrG n=1 Tax=Candidatus Methylospira mobilis TaxID=1808979 RepID=A0A5Q0BF71_9GAMM|nr:type VI secretion system tip protein TssI/VgrG [Candidatus Methylospira mobilis]QFY42159.1 type VI secretion system tip protein VgrG [Candidatus Methylospira mobilis]